MVDGLSLSPMTRLSFGLICSALMLDLLSMAVPESLYNLTLHGLICRFTAGGILMLVGSRDLQVYNSFSLCETFQFDLEWTF